VDDKDFPEFAAVWIAAHEVYGKTPTGGAVRLCFEALRKYSIGQIKAALSDHVRNSSGGQFPPKPADIVRALEGTKEDKALLAWTKVDKAVRHVGPYRSVSFRDPVIAQVIRDMGGWIRLCECTEDEWPFVRNDFVKRYQGYSGRQMERQTLSGITERDNGAAGIARVEHMTVGDEHEVPMLVVDDNGGSEYEH